MSSIESSGQFSKIFNAGIESIKKLIGHNVTQSGNNNPITHQTDNMFKSLSASFNDQKVKLGKSLGKLKEGMKEHMEVFTGAFNRITVGSEVELKLPTHNDKDTQQKIDAVTQFNVTPKDPLSPKSLDKEQIAKAKELLNDLTKPLTPAQMNGLESLIKKEGIPRIFWSEKDVKALDDVNFALIQDHFINLNECLKDFPENMHGIDFQESLIAETLAKSLAYTQVRDGHTIKIPVRQENETFELKEFEIKSLKMGHALPCYSLTPKNDEKATAWLVVRGTENLIGKGRKGAFESVAADFLSKTGLAETPTREAMEDGGSLRGQINKWGDRKFNIAGHSLGGCYANDLAIRQLEFEQDNPGKVSQLGKAYGFNPPGVSNELAETFDNLKLEKKEERLVNIHTQKDLISCAGRQLRGTHLEVQNKTYSGNPIAAHLGLVLSREGKMSRVDIKKESDKPARKLIEGTRKAVATGLGGLIAAGQEITQKTLVEWLEQERIYNKGYKIL